MAKRKRWPKVRPVIVRWVDSTATGGWDVEANDSKMECVTVGHLVDRNKDRVSIVQSCSHYSNGELLEIPTFAVKSVRKLKK